MVQVSALALNSLLAEKYIDLTSDFKEKDLIVDFWDFITSQNSHKIFNFDYRNLITASTALNDLYVGSHVLSDKHMTDLVPLYNFFTRIVSVVGIKLYILFRVKLYISVPKRIYNEGIEVKSADIVSDRINIVTEYIIDDNINTYISILKSENVVLGDTKIDTDDLDFDYLSKLLVYYKTSNSGIFVIERS